MTLARNQRPEMKKSTQKGGNMKPLQSCWLKHCSSVVRTMTQAPVHIENQYQLFSLFQAELLQFPLIHCRRLCRPHQCLFETCLWLHFSLSSYQRNECSYKMADKYHLRLPVNAIKKYQWTFKKTLILPLKVVFCEEYYQEGWLMWPCSSLFAPSFTKIKNHNGYEVRYTCGYKYYPQPHAIQTKSLMSNQKLSRVFHLVSLKG